MSYEKQTWQTNDVITAEKLNHMEDGIASDGDNSLTIMITMSADTETYTLIMDKTYAEIASAVEAGKTITLYADTGDTIITFLFYGIAKNAYAIFVYDITRTMGDEGQLSFFAESADDVLSCVIIEDNGGGGDEPNQ